MLATTLTDETIAQTNKMLEFVLTNEYSDLYKKKYSKEKIILSNYEDFQKIPFITKEELLACTPTELSFFPLEKITTYLMTSGTTGKPLITPHEEPMRDFTPRSEITYVIKNKKILNLFPTTIAQGLMHGMKEVDVKIILGEIHNLPLMAQLLHQTDDIKTIFTTPTLMIMLINELKQLQFDLTTIERIMFVGELCSSKKWQYFKKIMPNAYIDSLWGATENGGVCGYQCKHLAEKGMNFFHPNPQSQFFEIIDENGSTAKEGTTGEIVYSDLTQTATMLLRYKTGDLGAIEDVACPCGNKFVIKLVGRGNNDILHFHGATLLTNAIEDALTSLEKHLQPGFQMHVFEEELDGKIMPKLKLQLLLIDTKKASDLSFKKMFIEQVSKNLRVSQQKMLSDLVEMGAFLPLEIEFVQAWPQTAKTKPIISHLK